MYGVDLEGAAGLGDATQPSDASVQGVIADDTPLPAAGDL
jgi:hypothetical protein